MFNSCCWIIQMYCKYWIILKNFLLMHIILIWIHLSHYKSCSIISKYKSSHLFSFIYSYISIGCNELPLNLHTVKIFYLIIKYHHKRAIAAALEKKQLLLGVFPDYQLEGSLLRLISFRDASNIENKRLWAKSRKGNWTLVIRISKTNHGAKGHREYRC